MNADDLLAKLGALVRDERRSDDAFERAARDDAPERSRELEVARPLDEAAIDRLASRIARARAPARAASLRRRVAAYAAPLALAAAVLLLVTRGTDAGPELPRYVVTASAERAMRGGVLPAGRLYVGPAAGSRFEIIARPAFAVAPDVTVVGYAFAMVGDEPVAVDVKTEISDEGTVRVTGDARALGSTDQVRLVIATPGGAGSVEEALERARSATADERVRVLMIDIDRHP